MTIEKKECYDLREKIDKKIEGTKESIDTVEDNLNKLILHMDFLKKDFDRNTELTEKIHESLTGNGKKGIATRISLLENSNDRCWWFLGAIIIMVLSATVKIWFL